MRTIILKVTHICNLGCKYCCVGDTLEKDIVSDKTLDSLFGKLASDDNESTIIFHGGEPLCVGIDFYKRVVELQSKYPSHTFHNSLQTNGSLLNDEWLDFFKANNFNLGFSIDGCKVSHDLNRPYKNGRSSFNDTLSWFNRAREIGMNVGAICVINVNTAKHIDEIYDFAKTHQISFKFNPQYPAGRAAINVDLGLSSKELKEAYIRLFDLWYNDKPEERVDIRMFEFFVAGLSSVSKNERITYGYDCSFANRCQYSFIGIAPNGDMFPCGKFVGDDSFKYGNINEDRPLKEILSNDIVNAFIKRHTNGVKACEGCKFKPLCSSGCPHTPLLYGGTLEDKNPFCESLKALLSHIENRLIGDSCRKDIFIVDPANDEGENIIYSPLRNGAFLADRIATNQVSAFLNGGDLEDINNLQLREHIVEWHKQIPHAPIPYDINITDSIVVLLTNKCNLHCSYCYASESHSIGDTITEIDLFSIIDHALKNHSLRKKTFSFVGGGEPTMEWDLFKRAIDHIRTIQKNQHIISITTNGTILDNEKIAWLKDNDIRVCLSFGVLPELQFERVDKENRSTFEKVDKVLKLLLEAKIHVTIRSTITPRYVDRMEDIVRRLHDNYPGAVRLHLEPVMDNRIDYGQFLDSYLPSFIKAYKLGRQYQISVYNMLSQSINTLKSRFCVGEYCVTPKGDITACHRFSAPSSKYFELFSYGKFHDGVIHIANQDLQRVKHFEEEKKSDCKECFAKYHCAGMCPAMRVALSNGNREAYCAYTKKLLGQLLYLNINNELDSNNNLKS